ncbi:hypothetical protein ABK040_001842 [Willaertia magna]
MRRSLIKSVAKVNPFNVKQFTKVYFTIPSLLNINSNNLFNTIQSTIFSNQFRFYAQKGAKGKSSGGSGNKKEFLTDVINYKDLSEKMEKFVESCKKQLSELRSSSGATPSMVENIMVTLSDDSKRPVKALASIVVKNPKCLTLNVFDKTTTGAISRGIAAENLGFNPQQINENVIDIPVPKMTKEMRENVVKNVKKVAESCKEKVRDMRRNAMTKLKGQGSASKDDIFADEQTLQALTEEVSDKIDKLVEQKEKDIMKEKL